LSEIQSHLVKLHDRLRNDFKTKWKRSLPFYEEILGDQARWDRASFLGFREGTSVYESSYVYGDVKVGKGTWIGPFTILDGSGGLEIGDYCSISSGVQIYSHETAEWALTGGRAGYRHKPTRIGNCCFIGSLSIVRMGVNVGDHVLVGAHSYVNTDVPSNSIVTGSPARLIGRIEISNGTVKMKYSSGRRKSPRKRSG